MVTDKMHSVINEFNIKKNKFEETNEYISLLDSIDYYCSFFGDLIKNCVEPYIAVSTFNDYLPKYDFENSNILEQLLEFLKTIKKMHVINISTMFDSLRSTLFSIYRSIEVLNISDSFALLRKFKDDYLLTILFSLLGNRNHVESGISNDLWISKIDIIFKFAQNSMNNTKTSEVVKFITSVSSIKELDVMIGINSKFKEMTDLMNKFTHSHGLLFINKSNPIRDFDNTINMLKTFSQYLDTIMSYLTCIILYLNPKLVVTDKFILNSNTAETITSCVDKCNLSYLHKFINERVMKVEPGLYNFLSTKICF